MSHFIVTLWVANMKKIQDYVNRIDEELSDAKEYAEKYVECKAEGKDSNSRKYKEMAEDELKQLITFTKYQLQKIKSFVNDLVLHNTC